MRSQGKERSIKLELRLPLYTVVDNLAKHGLIRPWKPPRRTAPRAHRVPPHNEAARSWRTGLLSARHPGEGISPVRGGSLGDPMLNRAQVRDVSSTSGGPGEDVSPRNGRVRPLPWPAAPVPAPLEAQHHLTIREAELAWDAASCGNAPRTGPFPLIKDSEPLGPGWGAPATWRLSYGGRQRRPRPEGAVSGTTPRPDQESGSASDGKLPRGKGAR